MSRMKILTVLLVVVSLFTIGCPPRMQPSHVQSIAALG